MRRFDRPGRSPVYSENGMAATSHPLATRFGARRPEARRQCRRCGVAASATLSVVEPHSTGIGGDCFAIVVEPDGTVHGLNGSGRAPAAVDPDWYRSQGFREIPETGPHAVTVPGAINAWEMLLSRLGTLPFAALFADAIRLAEEGFAVHPRVGSDWARQVDALAADEGGAPPLSGRRQGARHRHASSSAGARRDLAPDRRARREGLLRGPGRRRDRGDGSPARRLSRRSRPCGGRRRLGRADSARFAGHDVLEIPPNGQGITALIMFRLLQMVGASGIDPDGAERYHLEIEAGRLAYSVRDHMVGRSGGDDGRAGGAPVGQLRRGPGRPHRSPPAQSGYLACRAQPNSDTIYLTVVDRERRAVSFINSTYDSFGAMIVTPVSGVILQNRGACFSLVKGHPNEIGPGKRPMHTIIPAMAMKDGKAAVAFGVMGGAFQPMGHVHVFSNLAAHGMDPQEAIDHPRLFWGDDGVVEAESRHRRRPAARPDRQGPPGPRRGKAVRRRPDDRHRPRHGS